MNKLKGGLILFVIFIVAIYFSVYLDELFRRWVRYLYIACSNGKISFYTPKMELHFASIGFVAAFGLFVTGICFLFFRQTARQRAVNTSLGIILFLLSILTQCYVGSVLKIAECTACSDGTRKLHYGDINYDTIFIISIILAIIPFATTEVRKFINSKK